MLVQPKQLESCDRTMTHGYSAHTSELWEGHQTPGQALAVANTLCVSKNGVCRQKRSCKMGARSRSWRRWLTSLASGLSRTPLPGPTRKKAWEQTKLPFNRSTTITPSIRLTSANCNPSSGAAIHVVFGPDHLSPCILCQFAHVKSPQACYNTLQASLLQLQLTCCVGSSQQEWRTSSPASACGCSWLRQVTPTSPA